MKKMDISNDNQKVGESIIKGKAMKKELGNQIDTVNNEEFFGLIEAIDDNSKIESP